MDCLRIGGIARSKMSAILGKGEEGELSARTISNIESMPYFGKRFWISCVESRYP
jgi:hypothetical protein